MSRNADRVAAAEQRVAAVEAEAEHARVDRARRSGRSRAASRRRCRRGSGTPAGSRGRGSARPRAGRFRPAASNRASPSQASGSSSIRPAPAIRSGSQNASEISAIGRVSPGGSRLVEDAERPVEEGHVLGDVLLAREPQRQERPDEREVALGERGGGPGGVAEVAGRPQLRALVTRVSAIASSTATGSGRPESPAVSSNTPNDTGAEAIFIVSPSDQGTRGSRSMGPGVPRPRQVGVVLRRHRALLGGERVQVVAVVAVRRAERVVPARHQQHVEVAHRPRLVQIAGAAVQPLHAETPPAARTGRRTPLRGRSRPGSRSCSCLCGGYDDQLPPGVSTSTTSSRWAGNSGGTMWLIWRVALPDPAPPRAPLGRDRPDRVAMICTGRAHSHHPRALQPVRRPGGR